MVVVCKESYKVVVIVVVEFLACVCLLVCVLMKNEVQL